MLANLFLISTRAWKEEIMAQLFLTLVVGLLPQSTVLDDTADIVELNHYYDHRGDLVFNQLIFWQWCADQSVHRVFAWRIVKSPQQFPLRDWQRDGYTTIWQDQRELRRVRSTATRRTWTQYDPEVLDRQHVPRVSRPGLARRQPPQISAK